MKRLIIQLLFLIAAAAAATAQTGLAVEPFFDDGLPHADGADVTAVAISGKKLKPHGLSIYRSVSVTGDQALADRIERAVTRDGTKAESREVSLKSGRLHFGFYTLPPLNGEHRYLFYLNSAPGKNGKTTIIFMQGTAPPEKINSMLNRNR